MNTLPSFPKRIFSFFGFLCGSTMCATIEVALKLAVAVINCILAVGFLILALIGILLRTSPDLVRNIIHSILNQFPTIPSDEQMKTLVTFVSENEIGVSAALIVMGLALATLCIVGFIAACCDLRLLLKIYALILGILLAGQVIGVIVVFSDEARYTNSMVELMSNHLSSYGNPTATSTILWDILMTTGGPCCGMNGPEDFKDVLAGHCSRLCCADISCNCLITAAVVKNGCRGKLILLTKQGMTIFFFILLGAMIFQFLIFLITLFALAKRTVSPF
nr:unnamed protein product [Spirometra erinaceieuropaei]